MSDYVTGFTVKATPAQVFAAINDVRGWWIGDIEGASDQIGAEFTYRNKEWHFSRQQVAEMALDKRVVWHVADSQLTFTPSQRTEWNGTDIVFEIEPKGDDTELRFTHIGLMPACECYRACSGGWTYFIDGSLKTLIETGKGSPPLG